MTLFTSYRAQNTLPAVSSDGAAGNPRLNARLEVVTAPVPFQWVQDGKVFFITNTAKQTAIAMGGTSYSDTAPAILVDISAGTTMIPLSVELYQGGTVAGGVITVLITVDTIKRFSSGGTALTPFNARLEATSSAASTAAAAYYGATAAAVSSNVLLYGAILKQDVATSPMAAEQFVRWAPAVPKFLIGPASLVIYTFAAVTQPSWFFNITWAEIPTTSVK